MCYKSPFTVTLNAFHPLRCSRNAEIVLICTTIISIHPALSPEERIQVQDFIAGGSFQQLRQQLTVHRHPHPSQG